MILPIKNIFVLLTNRNTKMISSEACFLHNEQVG